MRRLASALVLLTVCVPPAAAGLHYSGETWAELPAQWRGYLLDQRSLRVLPAPPGPNQPASVLRGPYTSERDRLVQLAKERPLSADEAADLGALHVRLGEPALAADVLRAAQRNHPEDFRIAANLGTACQQAGELDQAAAALDEAVRLAPPRWKRAEELHRKLVRGRRNEAKGASKLDGLFPGVPPPDAVTLGQTLGLWLPGDGRVLWQLGELAHATGDVATAAAILDGVVSEFGVNDPDLRRQRQAYRAEAERLATNPPAAKADAASDHAAHGPGGVRFKSARPLVRRPDLVRLPPIRPDGVNSLPWSVLADTTLEKPFRATFAEHLRKLDGRRVLLSGYIQPTGDGLDQTAVLLIEFPVGCWFCEVPEPTGIILVEPPAGQTVKLTRDLIQVEGRLKLNASDPEEFLYTIRDARVGPPD
jgi:hypothetical protein